MMELKKEGEQTQTGNPKVFAIIVNYNGWQDTIKCLESLNSQNYQNLETIVVDNGSTDESLARINDCLDKIHSGKFHLITNPTNTGYSGGNNIGILAAFKRQADYFFLLNNDATIDKNCVGELVDFAQKNKNAGIVAPLILRENQPDTIWFGGGKFSWLSGGRHLNTRKKPANIPPEPKKIDFATGCAMLISRDAFKRIGFLEEEFFLYYEDIDWCLSARKAGIGIFLLPSALVRHKESSSARKLGNPTIHYYHFRNILYLASRQAPFLIKYAIYVWSGYVYTKQLIKDVLLPKARPINKMIKRGIADFYKARMGGFPGKRIIKIGIEGHELQKTRPAGVARALKSMLGEIIETPTIKGKYRFIILFNGDFSPGDELINPLIEFRRLKTPLIGSSFTFFYNVLVPIAKLTNKIDIMYFPSYMVPFLCFGKKIVTVFDVAFEAHPEWFPPVHRYSYKLLARYGAKKASAIITSAHFSKKEIVKYYKVDPNKIFVAHLAINDQFRKINDASSIGEVKNKYGLKNKYILFVAQILKRRQVPETIRAFIMIVKEFPELQLLVAGRNLIYPPFNLERMAKKLNSDLGQEAIILKEYIDTDEELAALFSGAELFIYISPYEGFGLPPLEAAKCQTPSVLGDTEMSRELFKDAAFYVKNTSDINEIAQIIKTALTDLPARQKIIQGGAEIVKKFSWAELTKAFLSAINDISKK